MKFFEGALIALSLYFAAAREQGQASGLSRSLLRQDAATSSSVDDSDDAFDAALSRFGFANAVDSTNGQKKVDTAKQLRQSAKAKATASTASAAAETDAFTAAAATVEAKAASEAAMAKAKAEAAMAKAKAEAKAEATMAKAEVSRAVGAARAEAKNSARLKTELAKAVRNQYNLRRRLKLVGTEARARLAQLLKQLEIAKAAAHRSEGLLRGEIQKESAKLKTLEVSESQLHLQLASAQAASLSSHQSAAAAAAQAEGKSKANRKAMNTFAAELKSTQQAAAMQTSRLQMQLRQMQQADVTAQAKLMAQMKLAQEAATKDRSALVAKITEAQRASEKVSDELDAEQSSEKLLRANLTRTVESAELAAAKAKKEKMGLLVQVSELQEQSSGAQKKAAAAEKEAKLANQDAKAKIDQETLSAKHQDDERQRHISALLQETQAAHANLTIASSAAAAARREVSTLQTTLKQKEEQLRVALLESNELRAARDVATKGEATFQSMDTTAEASLKQARQEFSSATKELQRVKSEITSRVSDASTLSAKCKTLEAQLISLKQQSATKEASTKQQMHDALINAAAKVHDLEDQNENVTSLFETMKKQLVTAQEDSAKSKDTLMQETDASLKATQQADSLQKAFDKAQKQADGNSARAAELTKKVADLRSESDRAKVVIQERVSDEQKWQAKAETLESATEGQNVQVKSAEAENKRLKAQLGALTGQEQRADELEEELSSLRAQMQKKDSEEASMAKNLEMLRSLKDHYSTDSDSSRKEADTWHQKAEDFDNKLKKTKQQLEAVAHQGDKNLERAKEARSQEDEYFEENSRLEQQDEALNTKLTEIGAASNHSQDENRVLHQKLQDLKSEEAREKANSHSAWVENQDELMQARRDVQLSLGVNRNLQAELERTRAVLSDKGRQTVGLPPLKKDTTAKAVTSVVVQLAENHDEGPATQPLTPQVSEVKHWEKTADVAKPPVKRLMVKAVPKVPAPTVVTPEVTPKVALKAMPKAAVATVSAVEAVPVARALPAKKSAVKVEKPKAAPLPGEPPKPSDDAATTLASVTDPKPPSPPSALQKLAAFFASPLQR